MQQLSLFEMNVEIPKKQIIKKQLPKIRMEKNINYLEELYKKNELEQGLKIQEYDLIDISNEIYKQISDLYKTDKLKVFTFNTGIHIESNQSTFTYLIKQLDFYKKYNLCLCVNPNMISISPNNKLYQKLLIREQKEFEELMSKF